MSHPDPNLSTSVRRPWSPTPLSILADAVILLLLLGYTARFTIAIYALPASLSPVLGMCLLGGVVSTVLWALPRFRIPAVVVVALASGALLWCNQAQFLYGAKASWAALAAFWSENTPYPWQYALTNPLPALQHQAAVQTFLGLTFAFLALFLGWAIFRIHSFGLVFVLTLPWLMPALLAEVELDWLALMVICACWGTLLLSSLSARGNARGGARVTLLALPACLAIVFLVFFLSHLQGYTPPAWAANLREELLSLEWFPSPETQVLDPQSGAEAPRLDFHTAGPRQYTGRGILQISASQSGPMYLRGSIYQNYSSQAWTGVEPVALSHTPSSQNFWTASETATITYLTYLGSTAFLPYQTTQVEQIPVSPHGSVVFPNALREYSVVYAPLEEEPAPSALSSHDPQYQDARENYLEVPEELSGTLLTWLTQATDDWEANGASLPVYGTGIYASELNTAFFIAQLLADHAQYDLDTPRTPSGQDFVTYFLEKSHKGYCVHFATAATLLLRLQGIPARYVSGYAISIPSTPYLMMENTPVYYGEVLDFNAHAWVEIYLSGYGWYPVEVTPGTDAPNTPDPDESSPVSAPPAAVPTATPKPTSTPAATPKPSPTPEVAPVAPSTSGSLKGLVWGLPLLVVAGAVGLVYGVRRRKWMEMFHTPHTNAAVLDAYRWFGQLERWGGMATKETEALARKARFSPHTLTDAQRDAVLIQLRDEVFRLRQSAPIWKRWLLRLLFPVHSLPSP